MSFEGLRARFGAHLPPFLFLFSPFSTFSLFSFSPLLFSLVLKGANEGCEGHPPSFFFFLSLSLSLSLFLSFSFFFFFLPNTCTRVAHRPKRRNESHPPAHSAFFQSRTLVVHQTNRKIEFSLQSDLNEGLCVCLFRNQEIFYRFTFRFFEVSVGEKK